MAVLAELIGEVLDEKYHIEKQLGQGGMGAVYLATHLGTKRPVALKIITPQFMANEEFVGRFRREAEAAGRLRHPNVVNVTDFGFATVNNQRLAYLVMEYLDGCTLGEVLAEERRLPLNFVVDIIEQVCAAVEEAHQQGIIHRDLKPDNVWLEPNGRGGYTVKVLDFGLAKLGENIAHGRESISGEIAGSALVGGGQFMEAATQVQAARIDPEAATNVQMPIGSGTAINKNEDETAANVQMPVRNTKIDDLDEGETQVQAPCSTQHDTSSGDATKALTQAGTVLGTPIYMSPEQCKGEKLDTRTDLYSIGVITYEMLAGEPPFRGGMTELMVKHMSAPPPPLKSKRTDISKKIADLIMSTLAKDPAARPASAASFASALRARSEGAGTLLRQSITLYSEHFPTFLRVSMLAYIPVVIGLILLGLTGGTPRGDNGFHYRKDPEAVSSSAPESGKTGDNDKGHVHIGYNFQVDDGRKDEERSVIQAILLGLAGLIFGLCYFVTNAINFLAFVPVTVQLRLLPLRPVRLRPIFLALQKRWRETIMLMLNYYSRVILGFCFFALPGLRAMIYYLLIFPVLIMEGLKGRAALMRSKELVLRARGTVILICITQFAIPTIASSLGGKLTAAFASTKSNSFLLMASSKILGNLIGLIPSIIITPLIAVMLAQLYFNTRMAGGELLKDTLAQWDEDLPTTKWQQHMQERWRARNRISAAASFSNKQP